MAPTRSTQIRVADDQDLMREAWQQVLKAELTRGIGAEACERTQGRQEYRASPDSPPRGERYQCSKKAFVGTFAEMYVQIGRRWK